MFNKNLKKYLLGSVLVINSCTVYKGVPNAVNKPINIGNDDNYYEIKKHKSFKTYKNDDTSLLDLSKYIKERPVLYKPQEVNYNKNLQNNFINDLNDGFLRIGILTPAKSSQYVNVSKELKNASHMAIFDNKVSNVILQFYDTDGTINDTKIKTKTALEENVDIIVGPLLSDEVDAVNKVIDKTPVISFTTDTNVLSGNVFSIGFLIDQQIKRLVEYAVLNNKTKFGIITSNSESGKYVLKTFKKYLNKNNVTLVSDVMYENNSKNQQNLLNAVRKVADFDNRKKEYLERKNTLEKEVKDLKQFNEKNYNDAQIAVLEKELEKMDKQITINPPEYDSIFVFADNTNDLIMIGSTLMYYDVAPNKVKYLGLSQLENNKVCNEKAFSGAWYPSISTKYNKKFNSSYKKLFGADPGKMASFAYDAVSFATTISKKGIIKLNNIINPNGFIGINGVFRFKSDGSNDRNIDVKEIVGGRTIKSKIISPAPVNFIKSK